jgi:hypothetical protein
MYKIIGADGQHYGPASAEQIRAWIHSGRADAQTLAQAESTAEWKPLSAFPEFADALAAKAAPPPHPPSSGAPALPGVTGQGTEGWANEVLARDYDLDIFSCFGRAFERLQNEFWPIVGVSAVVLLLLTAAGATGVGIVLSGPLTGGLFLYYLKLIRGQKADMEDALSGFTLAFLQLFLGMLVSGLLTVVGIAFCLIPGIYLAVAWKLALPLIIDKRMEFWPAMELSRKVVTRQWWAFFGLVILAGMLNLAGVLLCLVGLFVTVPVSMMALMYAYEDIFSSARPAAAQPL